MSAAWGLPATRLVDGGGLGDHPLDGEPFGNAARSGLAHLPPQPVVLQQRDDRAAIARVIARRHEHAR